MRRAHTIVARINYRAQPFHTRRIPRLGNRRWRILWTSRGYMSRTYAELIDRGFT